MDINKKQYEQICIRQDPFYLQQKKAIDFVKNFIIAKKLVLYGGTAIDFALRLQGSQIYPDESLQTPDLDFYSPTHLEHAYELADILYAAGFANVRVIRALFVRTMRVDVGDGHYVADITYYPPDLFDAIPILEYTNMKLVHPDYQRADLHSSLTFPFDNPPKEVIFDRWSKDIERFWLLDKFYPIKEPESSKISKTKKVRISAEMRSAVIIGHTAYAFYWILFAEKYPSKREKMHIKNINIATANNGDTILDCFYAVPQLAHMNIRKFAQELNLKEYDIYEPYVNIYAERIVANNVEIFSTKNKLLSINSVKISGINWRIASIQHTLMYFTNDICKHASADAYAQYLDLLYMVREAKGDEPFGLTLNTYGADNISSTQEILISQALSDLNRAETLNLPANYYPDRKVRPAIFDVKNSKFFQISGKKIPKPVVGSSQAGYVKSKILRADASVEKIQKIFPENLRADIAVIVKDIRSNSAVSPLIYFDDIKHSLKYMTSKGITRNLPTVHIGQRKLFLTMLMFLTRLKYERPDCRIVIYAGAAPSIPHAILMHLFPTLRFLLVDPAPFHLHGAKPDELKEPDVASKFLKSSAATCIYNGFFTDDLAREIDREIREPIAFISDIRINVSGDNPFDYEIVYNNAQQWCWLKLMPRTIMYMLKFRHPFYNEGQKIPPEKYDDFATFAKILGRNVVEDYGKPDLEYVSGKLYLQPWAPTSSTETRLIGDDINAVTNYGDVTRYENAFMFYNRLWRAFANCQNPLATWRLCFCTCQDCALEYNIWKNYNDKIRKIQIIDYVERVSKILGRNLELGGHLKITRFPKK